MRSVVPLLAVFVCAFAPAARAEDSPVAPAVGGGEIRMVVQDAEIPLDLTAVGLVRFSESGAVVAAISDTWMVSRRGAAWAFHLRRGIRYADSAPITETDVLESLRSPRAKILFDPQTTILLSGDSIVFALPRRDPRFAEKLALSAAAIAPPRHEATGPFRILSRETDHCVLAPNPHSVVPVRPDTLVLLFEPDVSRGVFLVEAGSADVALVGDEDLARLRSDNRFRDRLVLGQSRRVHAFVSTKIPRASLLLLRRAVDRAMIARTLLNGRAESIGPDYRSLSPEERGRFPASIRIAERIARASNRRVLPRIAYDLRRSGLACEIAQPDDGDVVCCEFAEEEAPASAVPVLAVTPCWLVSSRVRNFSPPRDGMPGILAAQIESAP